MYATKWLTLSEKNKNSSATEKIELSTPTTLLGEWNKYEYFATDMFKNLNLFPMWYLTANIVAAFKYWFPKRPPPDRNINIVITD